MEEHPPPDGWKRKQDDPKRVAITFTVGTTALWAVFVALVGLVSNQSVMIGSDTRLKECSQSQETRSGTALQARKNPPLLGGHSEKPTVTLEGVSARVR